jgi:hypothetical protein
MQRLRDRKFTSITIKRESVHFFGQNNIFSIQSFSISIFVLQRSNGNAAMHKMDERFLLAYRILLA